jgi:hypothetical protein
MSISENEVIIGPAERSVGLLLFNVVAGPQRTTPYCQKRSVHRDDQEKPNHPIAPDGNPEPPKESDASHAHMVCRLMDFSNIRRWRRETCESHQCLFRTDLVLCHYPGPSGGNDHTGRVVALTCKLCAQSVMERSHEGFQ